MAVMTDITRGRAMSGGIWPIHFLGALVILLVCGGYAVWMLATVGKASFNTTNDGVHWGLPIVIYDYFLLTSTGLAMVAGLYHVLGMEAFRPVARRALWLAFAGLIGAVVVLFLELGDPILAMWATPANLQFASPLFWKVMLVAVYAVLLGLALLGMMGPAKEGGNPLVLPIALLAVAITLVAGSVYGMMYMRPMWFGGEIPVVFLIESLVGAFAFVVFFTYLAHGLSRAGMSEAMHALLDGPLPRFFAAAIALHLALLGGRAITGLWSNAEGLQVWEYIVSQPLFHFGIWGCTVLPLVLMLLPGTRRAAGAQILSAVLVMIGLFIARYEFVIGGQLVPLFKGTWATGLIEYAPSLTEWALLGTGIGVANLIYAFAGWFLNAGDER